MIRCGILLVLGLQSCALAPGMVMQEKDGLSNQEVPVLEDVKLVPQKVKITPITAELIIQQQALEQTPRVGPPKPEGGDGVYRIGPYDILNITVWDHPELTIPAREYRSPDLAGQVVAGDGTLFFPYAGVINVEGKTVEEVRSLLTEKLSRYIANVQLDVRVIAYRSQRIYVVGEVTQPGIQSVTDVPLTIAEAINRSGGVTLEADMRNITLSRGNEVFRIDLLSLYENGDAAQNILLKGGDVLNVPDRKLNKVFVLSEVSRPSSQIINKGRITLAEALSDAGGVNPTASKPENIFVFRGSLPAPEIFHLNAKSPDALMLAGSLPPQGAISILNKAGALAVARRQML